MSSHPKITEDLKRDLRSVLLSKAGGVELDRISADYRKFVGTVLPFRQCGFDSIQSFIQAVPDVAKYALSSVLMGKLIVLK